MLPLLLALLPAHAAGWPDLSERPDSGRMHGGRDAAVIVGIGDYVHLPDIPGAADLAQDWQSWLVHARGVPAKKVTVLTDRGATRAAIARAAVDAALEVGDDGTLWIVYMGHGATMPEGVEALLLGAETEASPEGFVQGGVAFGSLLDFLGIGTHQNAIIVLDTSFSGLDREGQPLVPNGEPTRPWIGRQTGDGVLAFLAAGDRGVAGLLPGEQIPSFGYLSLAALRGWGDTDNNGDITAGELLENTRKWVRALDPTHAQMPEVRGKGLGVVVSEGREAKPDLFALAWEAELAHIDAVWARLDQRGFDALTRVNQEWATLAPLVTQDPVGKMPELRAFLARNTPLRVDEAGIARWIAAPVVAEAQSRLVASAGTVAARAETPAGARHIQDQEEMRHLMERNAWKGVETSFQDALSLESQGEVLTVEDWLAGAQAARGLGQAMDVRLRLVRAYSLVAAPETVTWLNDLETQYGPCSLRNERKELVSLEPVNMPFAPDLRAAIETANVSLTETRRFDGLLPRGLYRFGTETLLVSPGSVITGCDLTGEGCRPVR